MKRTLAFSVSLLIVLALSGLTGRDVSMVQAKSTLSAQTPTAATQAGDQELARLLVKLEKQTRAVIAGHYVAADGKHRDWMARNVLLPAAVADKVFYTVVPETTNGRAWVKMVVDEPRNPHNKGDAAANELLRELRNGETSVQRSTSEAYYYAEPIKAAKTCLMCHGKPAGQPDPFFPQYKKNGWIEGQIVGAIVARVAPAS